MKTVNSVTKDNSQYKSLIKAVIAQLGAEGEELQNLLSDVRNHGANVGFSGFIYYTETHAFAMKNRKSIVAMLQEQANDFGQEVVEMVSGFGAFRNSPMDNDDRKQLYAYLGGGKPEKGTITNLMAWYALEEVARMFEND
jgi:hypothetical protein